MEQNLGRSVEWRVCGEVADETYRTMPWEKIAISGIVMRRLHTDNATQVRDIPLNIWPALSEQVDEWS